MQRADALDFSETDTLPAELLVNEGTGQERARYLFVYSPDGLGLLATARA
jgi:hypothetical protein